jgi:hypothetical protein
MANLVNEGKLKKAYLFSTITLILFFCNAVISLIFPKTIYNTSELYNAFLINDLVNLIIGPGLILVMWLTKKKRAIGLFCWSGALLFVIYNHIAYLISVNHFYSYIFNSLILITAAASLLFLTRSLYSENIYNRLKEIVPRKTFGSIILVLGFLFVFRAIFLLVKHYTGMQLLTSPEVGVNFSDFIVCFLWIIAGILILNRKRLGYAFIIGLYFQSSLLFLGLIIFLLLKPLVLYTPFSAIDVGVVAIMSMICIVPFIILTWRVVNNSLDGKE